MARQLKGALVACKDRNIVRLSVVERVVVNVVMIVAGCMHERASAHAKAQAEALNGQAVPALPGRQPQLAAGLEAVKKLLNSR